MKAREGEHPFGDTGQMIALGVFAIVWIADSFFLRLSTFLSDSIPLAIRLIVLAATFVVAVLLFRSGHRVVSHERHPGRVISTGAFRYVRHPLYLASMLSYLGLSVSTASLFSIAVTAGIFLLYNSITAYEERWMESRYGDEYAHYRARTGKWLPRIRRTG